jgi:wyosine [tRNA(Phe)-imidazoG37] synthetase (radical SAM superfamily)
MAGFLFHDIIFGPVRSRRLGLSLGVNLLPTQSKYCSFNCIYCECGWSRTDVAFQPELPSRELTAEALELKLQELVLEDYLPDAITYAGNGEPTLHPDFPGIVDDTLRLRDQYIPKARVSVLSNASMLHDPAIFKALQKLDNNIQKLDSGIEKIFRLINNPIRLVSLDEVVENLKRFEGNVVIQSMFLRGIYKGVYIDNTKPEEVEKWIQKLRVIRPKSVMIYPIARETPVHNLEKIGTFELERIAEQVREAGLVVKVY